MAPEKIYISQQSDVFGYFSAQKNPPYNTEYIRKDALLEWAKDMKAETEDIIKQHPEDESLWAEMHWWEVVIGKLNSM